MAAPTKAHRLRNWWIRQVLRHHKLVLLLGIALSVVMGWRASLLEVDSDLRRLLPIDNPTVETIEYVEENFGATGSLNVVVAGGTPEARHAFTDAAVERFSAHPNIASTDHRLRSDYFVDRALYFLADEEMEDLSDRVRAWQSHELCQAAPDVCVEDPGPKSAERLRDFMELKREEAVQRAGFRDYYESEEHEALVFFMLPDRTSSDLEFSMRLTDETRAILDDVYAQEGPWRGTDLRYNAVGPYVIKADENEVIREDMVRSGLVGLVGVMFVVFLLFRSFRALLTLLVPLLAGVTWTLGATELVLGHLNTMTSLISSVVMGVGIDAGIHFLSRARRERQRFDDEAAIRRTFHALIAPLLVASATTVSAFVVMASSDFNAFREFGIIAAIGVGLCLLSMVTVYPALLRLIGIKKAKTTGSALEKLAWPVRALLARPGLIFGALVVVTVFSAHGVDRVRQDGFERNGRTLSSDQTRATVDADTHLISQIFGKDIHASVFAVEGLDEIQRVFDIATRRHQKRVEMGETSVADLVAVPSFLPPPDVDQEVRRQAIEELTEDFSERTWARLEGRDPDAPRPGEDDEFGEFDDEFDDFPEEEGDTEGAPGGDTEGAAEPAADTDATAEDTGETEGELQAEGEGEGEGDGEGEGEGAGFGAPPRADPPDAPKSEDTLSEEDIKTLRRMIDAKPFGVEDLPPAVLEKLRGKDGKWALFAYPNYDAADILQGLEFAAETQTYRGGHDGIFVGETSVYAEMYKVMSAEWAKIFAMATVLVAGMVYWQMRSVSQMLLTLLPLFIGLWWLIGMMGMTDVKFTLFNVPILPAIVGIGVDNGVYLVAGIRAGRRPGGIGLGRAVDETGRAILAATATTISGFAAFLVADNGGLRGIGMVAVLGISMASLTALLAIPTLARLGERRQQRLAAAERSADQSRDESRD